MVYGASVWYMRHFGIVLIVLKHGVWLFGRLAAEAVAVAAVAVASVSES